MNIKQRFIERIEKDGEAPKYNDLHSDVATFVFVSKGLSLSDIKPVASAEHHYHVKAPIIMEMPSAVYEEFTEALSKPYSFIQDYADVHCFDDNSNTCNCMLIRAEGGKDGILVCSQGHDYVRYAAYIPDCSALPLAGSLVLKVEQLAPPPFVSDTPTRDDDQIQYLNRLTEAYAKWNETVDAFSKEEAVAHAKEIVFMPLLFEQLVLLRENIEPERIRRISEMDDPLLSLYARFECLDGYEENLYVEELAHISILSFGKEPADKGYGRGSTHER